MLWAGRITQTRFHVSHVLIPEQYTSPATFRIPNDEMFRLLQWIAERDLVLGVQVHSHPEQAFHSEADDEHCILQHRGAISIVVPDCGNVSLHDFFTAVAVYKLQKDSEWTRLPAVVVATRFVVEDQ